MHFKAVVKKLSAIRQGTWSVHNQCNLLKRTGLCIAAAWCWWKETLCSQSLAPPTLCCIYIWSRETWSKTEFLWKVHNSALFETRRLFGNALLSRREDLIFFAFLLFIYFFSTFRPSRFIRQSVWPHTGKRARPPTNTIYPDGASRSKRNINQSSNTSAFSSQAK